MGAMGSDERLVSVRRLALTGRCWESITSFLGTEVLSPGNEESNVTDETLNSMETTM